MRRMQPGIVIEDSCWFDLAPSGGGAPYRIFLALPKGPAPPGGFPVLYLLDANASFATLVEAQRRGAERPAGTGIGPMVLVGIGHPAEGLYDRARRTFDYTGGPGREAPGDAGMAGSAAAAAGATGGRDGFLAFLLNQLKPAIAARAPVDAGRQVVVGHSLAGGFVLDVFGRDSAAFAAYVAISPSIWWDEARLLAGLSQLRGAPRLSIIVGEWEQQLAPWLKGRPGAEAIAERRARRAMVHRARAFVEQARAALAGRGAAEFECLAGEDHASVVAPALTRALRFALADADG
ncbi:putative alpha/beta superfamily hydrolase [Ancylobacter sp. 3268]|uniref:alpha/beta hydrolase n=1 Tax=Ancylobacter sp. 3268 TaxID=2817752 RepID=UPI00285B89FF|nr:alpha/beta hydrolase-fold protein [Ancylobacter sp. 3268]MDR6953903.1 putative alpha/beta superfamily hydrolase [Ancylobacter sp. 3268]